MDPFEVVQKAPTVTRGRCRGKGSPAQASLSPLPTPPCNPSRGRRNTGPLSPGRSALPGSRGIPAAAAQLPPPRGLPPRRDERDGGPSPFEVGSPVRQETCRQLPFLLLLWAHFPSVVGPKRSTPSLLRLAPFLSRDLHEDVTPFARRELIIAGLSRFEPRNQSEGRKARARGHTGPLVVVFKR